jgi:hypothetical protein
MSPGRYLMTVRPQGNPGWVTNSVASLFHVLALAFVAASSARNTAAKRPTASTILNLQRTRRCSERSIA